MAAKVFAMQKQQEIQRLKGLGFRKKTVARVLRCSVTTVKKYWDVGHTPTATVESPPWALKVNWEEISARWPGVLQ